MRFIVKLHYSSCKKFANCIESLYATLAAIIFVSQYADVVISDHCFVNTVCIHEVDMLLQDEAYEEKDRYGELGKIEYTGRKVIRYCLVLDCLVAHDYR